MGAGVYVVPNRMRVVILFGGGFENWFARFLVCDTWMGEIL